MGHYLGRQAMEQHDREILAQEIYIASHIQTRHLIEAMKCDCKVVHNKIFEVIYRGKCNRCIKLEELNK